jgi:type I restriction enzyme, S subunit
MELRAGYRQTDLGDIPEDWDSDRLEKFWSVVDCKHVTARFVQSGFPIASIRETQARLVDLSEANYTTETFYLKLIEGGRKPRPGDLIFSRNATVGEVAQVTSEHPLFAMGQDVCLLRKRTDAYSTDFLQWFLKSRITARQIDEFMVGSTFRRVNVQQIKALRLSMPPPFEQQAIAAALSDAYALIASLDALIAKNRDLKQAAMQQLLTGKARLPGFEGEWVEKRLGDIADVVGGGTPKSTVPEYWGGDILWCTPTDITRTPGRYLDQTERTISQEGLAKSAANLLPTGALLLCTRATLGEVKIAGRPICTNQGFKSLICNSDIDNVFLYYKLLTMKQALVGKSSGSTFLEISKKDVVALILKVPPMDEQSAIATVLSDMDDYLAVLEDKREKAHALKQGMMQGLLTGRIRLA